MSSEFSVNFTIGAFEKYFSKVVLGNSSLVGYSDIQIQITEGKAFSEITFNLHKVLLAVHSSLLKSILCDKDTRLSDEVVIVVDGFQQSTIHAFVSLLYNGECRVDTRQCADELYALLQSLGIDLSHITGQGLPSHGDGALRDAYRSLNISKTISKFNVCHLNETVTGTLLNGSSFISESAGANQLPLSQQFSLSANKSHESNVAALGRNLLSNNVHIDKKLTLHIDGKLTNSAVGASPISSTRFQNMIDMVAAVTRKSVSAPHGRETTKVERYCNDKDGEGIVDDDDVGQLELGYEEADADDVKMPKLDAEYDSEEAPVKRSRGRPQKLPGQPAFNKKRNQSAKTTTLKCKLFPKLPAKRYQCRSCGERFDRVGQVRIHRLNSEKCTPARNSDEKGSPVRNNDDTSAPVNNNDDWSTEKDGTMVIKRFSRSGRQQVEKRTLARIIGEYYNSDDDDRLSGDNSVDTSKGSRPGVFSRNSPREKPSSNEPIVHSLSSEPDSVKVEPLDDSEESEIVGTKNANKYFDSVQQKFDAIKRYVVALRLGETVCESFSCTYCNAKNDDVQSLIAHIESTHTGEKPFGGQFQRNYRRCTSSVKKRGKRVIRRSYSAAPKISDQAIKSNCSVGSSKESEAAVGVSSREVDSEVSTKMKHVGENQFECTICGKIFNCKSNCGRHIAVTHTTERPFACDICGARFKSKEVVRRHKATHSNEKPFACDICNMRFKASEHLKQHKLTHSDDKPFACAFCQIRFRYKSNCDRHVRGVHAGEKFSCKHCQHQFSDRGNCQRHEQTVHRLSGEKSFSCKRCQLQFSSRVKYKRHMVSSHAGEKPVIPSAIEQKRSKNITNFSKCEKATSVHTGEKPAENIASDSQEPEQSSSNSSSNSTNSSKGEKPTAVHTGEKPVANSASDSREQLSGNSSSKSINGEESLAAVDEFSESEDDESRIELIGPQKSNVSPNPTSTECASSSPKGKVQCEQCDQTFTQVHSLKQHLRAVHLKIKSAHCSRCDQTFTATSSLNNHVRTVHLGEKPHKCPLCNLRVTTRNSLKLHLLRAHGQQ